MDISEFRARLQGAKGAPTQFAAKCPAHEDRHNSLSVGQGDDGRILVKCHAGCETAAVLAALGLSAADLFPSVQQHTIFGQKTKEDTAVLAQKRGIKPPVDAKMQKKRPGGDISAAAGPPANAKRARGETEMQICKTGEVVYLYTQTDGTPLFETVRIQYSDGSKSFRQRRREGGGKAVYNLNGVTPVLYRLPALQQELTAGRGEVYLCEGEKDADLLAGLGLCATTAPMGAGKWRAEYTEALSPARMVTILPDNDKPGRAHALLVAGELAAAGVPVQVCDLKALWSPLPCKGDVADVAEALGGEQLAAGIAAACLTTEAFAALAETRDAEDEAPAYRFETAAAYMKDAFWRDIDRGAAQPGLSTGFKGLDAQLEGRLYAGLYVVGSVSSLGKTAFCLQMADAIAAQGVDVLFFTLEMSRLEMVGRSVVRQAFVNSGFEGKYSVGQLLHGRLPGDVLDAAARDYYAKVAGHIAFIEGGFELDVAGVRRQVMRHHAATGRRPVVFVDYLQIIRPPDLRMSDKQATDHNVVELKRLSRALEVPVVAVSSFNRQSYSEEVNMAAFKESGAIEYSADFVMGLQARGISNQSEGITDEKRAARMVKSETRSAKKQDPRPIEAVTLKNRRGPAWACFELDFYPRQNYFAETGR